MKKLLVLVAAFTFVGQVSALRLVNPFGGFFKSSASNQAVEEIAPVAKVVAAEVSDVNAGFLSNVKAFQKEALAKAEVMISENPKAAVAYTVLATLVLEQVLSYVYNNFIVSNDDEYEDDEDLDIA